MTFKVYGSDLLNKKPWTFWTPEYMERLEKLLPTMVSDYASLTGVNRLLALCAVDLLVQNR